MLTIEAAVAQKPLDTGEHPQCPRKQYTASESLIIVNPVAIGMVFETESQKSLRYRYLACNSQQASFLLDGRKLRSLVPCRHCYFKRRLKLTALRS